MDQATFWRLIETIDTKALSGGDEEAATQPLAESLAQHTAKEIKQFSDILAQYLYDIDGKAYADQAGESASSDDGFLYARCYVVAQGKQYFESVKADPEKMPKSADEWCESLLYVAQSAWAISTGNPEDDWSHDTSVSHETGSNRAQWRVG